jgi:hypothetical protein
MPGDFHPGRDPHPIYLLILVALNRPGCELPMLTHIALCRHVGQLAVLIHMQHHRTRNVLLVHGGLYGVSIDGLPLDGLGESGGREPDYFPQVALQLALVHFWPTRISQRDTRQELDEHTAVPTGEPIGGRDPDEW